MCLAYIIKKILALDTEEINAHASPSFWETKTICKLQAF